MALIFCPECGTQVSEHAEACSKCAYPISKLNFKQASIPNTFIKSNNANNFDFNGVDYYYQQEFEEINKTEESYKGSWNWFAFFFSQIWLFSKGCWGFGLIVLITNCINSIYVMMNYRKDSDSILYGMGVGVLLNIILGLRGTYFYYNVKVKGKQFIN